MRKMLKGLAALSVTATALATTLPAFAQGQGELITPVDKELTFVFVPKVIHPWYDVVAEGGQRRGHRRKSVGLVVHAGDHDFHALPP